MQQDKPVAAAGGTTTTVADDAQQQQKPHKMPITPEAGSPVAPEVTSTDDDVDSVSKLPTAKLPTQQQPQPQRDNSTATGSASVTAAPSAVIVAAAANGSRTATTMTKPAGNIALASASVAAVTAADTAAAANSPTISTTTAAGATTKSVAVAARPGSVSPVLAASSRKATVTAPPGGSGEETIDSALLDALENARGKSAKRWGGRGLSELLSGDYMSGNPCDGTSTLSYSQSAREFGIANILKLSRRQEQAANTISQDCTILALS